MTERLPEPGRVEAADLIEADKLIEADERLHRPFDLADLPAEPWAQPDMPPKPAVAPTPRLAPAPLPRPSGLRQLRAAFVIGLALAIGIVALAVAFRPEQAAPDIADSAAVPGDAPTALGSGPVPAPASGSDVAQTTPAAAQVNLRIEDGMSDGRRAALEAAMAAAGYDGVTAAPAGSRVERGRIEFFHPGDRTAAEGLARSLAPLTGGQALGVHDMTAVTIDAAPGRIDVWIAE